MYTATWNLAGGKMASPESSVASCDPETQQVGIRALRCLLLSSHPLWEWNVSWPDTQTAKWLVGFRYLSLTRTEAEEQTPKSQREKGWEQKIAKPQAGSSCSEEGISCSPRNVGSWHVCQEGLLDWRVAFEICNLRFWLRFLFTLNFQSYWEKGGVVGEN